MNVLALLGIFVVLVMFIGNLAETIAHRTPKSPKEPLEDLRLAYAPDLIQVLIDKEEYAREKDRENHRAERNRIKEMYEHHARELQDAKIKRWLEGNPVTPDNPLTKKELPSPVRHNPYISSPFL